MSVGFFVSVFAGGVLRNGLEAKGVLSSGDHREWYRRAIGFGMHVFGLKPGAEPGIKDLGFALPEVRFQSALNVEMVELQFDCGNVFTKIAADIGFTNVQPGDATAF
jgi:hypothetical protein